MECGEVSFLRGEWGILQKGKPVAGGVWTHRTDAPSVSKGSALGRAEGSGARIPVPAGSRSEKQDHEGHR